MMHSPGDDLPPRPAQLHRDIDDELAHHLERAIAELERTGLSYDEARAEAEARLGDLAAVHREMYRIDHNSIVRARIVRGIREFIADVGFTARRIRRRPALMLVTVLTLAIGIGTALTFLGATDAILFRPLPIDEPGRVVTLWRTPQGSADERTGLAPGTIMDLAEESQSFTALAGAQPFSLRMERDGNVLSIGTWLVTDGFFEVLRAQPIAGRLPSSDDFQPGADPVVVVSHRFWRTYLGGDTAAVGRIERLNNSPHIIAGVLPPDFPYSEGRDLYRPIVVSPAARESRLADFWSVYARLRPDVAPEAAQAELTGLAARSDARVVGEQPPRGIAVVPMGDALLGEVKGGLFLLVLAGAMVLLMTVVNTSSLLLADAMGRARELAVRASVGAGRSRILRQLWTESLALATAAGIAGVAIGALGIAAFRTWAPAATPRIAELRIDARVIAIAVVLTLNIAALVSILPARIASRLNLQASLKAAADGSVGRGGIRLRTALVGMQVALAVVLTASGGLLIRSWIAVTRTDQGYLAQGVVGIEQHIWASQQTPEARATFVRELTTRLGAMPGIDAAAVATSLPLAPGIGEDDAGVRRDPASPTYSMRAVVATPSIFDALAIGRVRGRTFTEQDASTGELVAVMSEAGARQVFGDADPLGQYIETQSSLGNILRRVIGVVEDVRFESPEMVAEPTVYVPHAQAPTGSVYFVTRSSGPARASLQSVLAVVGELLPGAPLNEYVVLEEALRSASMPRRFSMLLLASFAAVALVLTAVGLFGLLAQLVRLRERELGVRLALGAWPGQLQAMMLAHGLRVAVIGALAGLVVFTMAAGVLRALVYGTAPRDPLSLVVTSALVLTTAAMAAWWPARQATRVDPMRALRAD